MFTAVSGTAFVVAVLEGAGATLVTVLAFVSGLCVPPVSPSLRSLLPSLVGRERLDTAFALDALLLELVFIAGPLLAAGIATAISPQVAFLTGVAFQAAGGLGVAASPVLAALAAGAARARHAPRRRARHAGDPRARARAGADRGRARRAGDRASPRSPRSTRPATTPAGCSRCWSVGSLAGGLWYGARQWRLPPHLRFLVVTGVLAAGLVPLPLAGSMPVFAVLVIVAGLGLAPSTAAAYSLIGDLAPAGAVTEAYSWQIVGYVAGSAVGAWLAGVVVEQVERRRRARRARRWRPRSACLLALAGRRAITV